MFKFEAKMNGHTKRQITLFIGVIETKFENPRKGLEALFKTSKLAKMWPKCQGHLVLKPESENPPNIFMYGLRALFSN